MSKVITRTPVGFTHNYALDIVNVVPDYFTGTFNTVVYATGITGQIDGTVPTAVSNGAYFVCTRAGTVASTGQVFQLGHIYFGVAGEWVDEGIKNATRMVPTINLTGYDLVFVANLEYTYTREAGDKMHTMGNVVYDYGKGYWRISGELTATTPTSYQEAASSPMRYGVGSFNAQATRAAGTITLSYTVDSVTQFRQDPRTVTWKALTALNGNDVATLSSPVTAFRTVFSDTTPGLLAIVLN